jgi:pyruvate kinase
MNLVWGVRPYELPASETVEERVRRLDEVLQWEALAQEGDMVVIAMAAPGAKPGSTNIMFVHRVGDSGHSLS